MGSSTLLIAIVVLVDLFFSTSCYNIQARTRFVNSIEQLSFDRRQWLTTTTASVTTSTAAIMFGIGTGGLLIPPARADNNSKYTRYEDTVHGFSIEVPADWSFITQKLSDRRTIKLWIDPTDPKSTNVFIAFTPVRDDFTSLGSFGSVDQFAAQTILPKGELAGLDARAKLLSAVSRNQAYYFDYIQTVPNIQPETHMRAIFTLQQGATGGAGAVLVTISAQTLQERYEKNGLQPVFDTIIDSFRRI